MTRVVREEGDDYPPLDKATLRTPHAEFDLRSAVQVRACFDQQHPERREVFRGEVEPLDATRGVVPIPGPVQDAIKAAPAGSVFIGEYEITWPGDLHETVPNDGYLTVEIAEVPRLGRPRLSWARRVWGALIVLRWWLRHWRRSLPRRSG